MRLRRLLCVLLCLPLGLLIAFSGVSIKASALSGGRYMTLQEALQVFGSEIQAKYFDGTGYVDCVFRYDSVKSITGIESEATYQFATGAQFLRYYCFQTGVVRNPQYITFDIEPTYSISNTNQIHTFIALGSDGYVSDSYQSPSWDWSVGGSTIHLENNDRASAGSYIRARLSGDDLYNASFVPFDWSSPNTSSGYSFRATFSGNQPLGYNSDRYVLALGIPYISSDATGAAGTLPPESSGGSGDVNVTVNVDMSETNQKLDESNGFLSSIVSWITDFFSNLGSFFVGLFVPAEGFIDNWKEDLAEAIADTFSPVDTVNDTLDRLKQAFDIAGEGSINALEFPAISIPGTSFSTPAVSVPLRPMSDSSIYDRIAKFIDIIATIAVFNMLLTKFKAFLVGEKVVEIEDVD